MESTGYRPDTVQCCVCPPGEPTTYEACTHKHYKRNNSTSHYSGAPYSKVKDMYVIKTSLFLVSIECCLGQNFRTFLSRCGYIITIELISKIYFISEKLQMSMLRELTFLSIFHCKHSVILSTQVCLYYIGLGPPVPYASVLSNPQHLSSACDPKHSCTKKLVNLRAGAVTQQNNK